MDEIKELHTRSLEWGCICNLVDKISDIENNMEGHWDELAEMVAQAITGEQDNKNPETLFFNLYEYMFRLYYRVRNNPTKRPFNQMSKTEIKGETVYRITNYDYSTFKWAKKMGYLDTVGNDYIDFPSKEMPESLIRTFERRLA